MNPLFKVKTNPMMDMALSLLKSKNANGYQQIKNLMAQNINPDVMAKQMISKLAPNQKQQLKQMAESYGVPIDDYLK